METSPPAALAVSHPRLGRRSTGLLLRLTVGRLPRQVTLAGWVVFGLALVILAGQGLSGVLPQDEGVLLTYPWLIARGALPYRDFWMLYPPTTFVALAGLAKVGVPALIGDRALGFLARVGYVLLVNRTLTGSWRRFSWVGVPLTFSLLFLSSDIRAYPWVLGLPVVFGGLLGVEKRTGLAVLLFFLATTIRLELGAVGLVSLTALAVIRWAGGTEWRPPLAGSAALAGLMVSFYGALELLTGGQAVRDLLVDPFTVIAPLQRLPLTPASYGLPFLPVAALLLGLPPLVVVPAAEARSGFLVATNFGTLVGVAHFLQRADTSHLFGGASLVVPWALLSLVRLRAGHKTDQDTDGPRVLGGERSQLQRLGGTAIAAVAAIAGLWCSVVVAGYAVYLSPLFSPGGHGLQDLNGRLVSSGTRWIVAMDRGEAADDRQVASYLAGHANRSQRVLIVPYSVRYMGYTMTDLYYLLGMQPASRYLEMEGMEKEGAVQREMIRGLGTCRWVILLTGGDWYYHARVPRGSGLLERYIQNHYRLVLQNTTYRLLERRSASSH